LEWPHAALELARALNRHLPHDLAVRAVEHVPDGFHPRYAARSRTYAYSIYAEATRDPLRERRSWRVWPAPDLERMRAACDVLVGQRDFRAFGSAPGSGENTVRRVIRAEWTEAQDGLTLVIEADAFLFRMVRRIVSAMICVGQGKTAVEALERLLADPESRWQRGLAPAHGLCLERVTFE
jgi:tRNA pseudouridine38-40 synthase